MEYYRKQNFLQKLYSREVHGSFFRGHTVVENKAIRLFGGLIPERLIFLLSDMFEGRSNHVLVGTSRCGQFLITYSYTSDLRQLPEIAMHYKYRLHWWAFRGSAPAVKVAEVQLFDSQDTPSLALHVGIAQWPNVNDRLVVYGYNDDIDQQYLDESTLDSAVVNRKYYITVTTLPSLHNCGECKKVAESFDEEDMAAIWDHAISFSCLKHGLTIHTTLDVAPPYPIFDPITSLKIDNKIIVNTGNFLHVLSFAPDEKKKSSTEPETIVPDEISHRIGELLSTGLKYYKCPWKKSGNNRSLSLPHRKTISKSISNAWLNTIMDKANKVYAYEEPEDGCEPRFKWFKKRRLADKMYEFCIDNEDMENKCPPAKLSRVERRIAERDAQWEALKKIEEQGNEYWFNKFGGPQDRPLIPGDQGTSLFRGSSEQTVMSYKVSVPNSSVCDSNNSSKCDIQTNKSLNKSCSQEKNDCSKNVVPQQNPTQGDSNCLTERDSYLLSSVFTREELSKIPQVSWISENDPESADSDCRPTQSNVPLCKKFSNSPVTPNPDDLYSPWNESIRAEQKPSCSGCKSGPPKLPSLDISVINPDLAALLSEWEADSVSSLSPRSDSLSKNDVIQAFLERIPGVTISPRNSRAGSSAGTSENLSPKVNDGSNAASKMSSPNSSAVNKYSPLLVVLRTRNCNQDKEPQKTKEQEDRHKAVTKEEVVSKVTVKSTKEPDVSVKQHMISGCSVRFDRIYIELDYEIMSTTTDIEDDDEGTGFHCALPLSVHGSAYAQLQMVSSLKVEKLDMKSERVYQTSFDIEQFCFKAAGVICKCEGFRFWFVSDYDVELIDVCAFNGDILSVVCLRVNAEKKPAKSENCDNGENRRSYYSFKCVFVWNPVADQCRLEAYSSLVETLTITVSEGWDPPLRNYEAPARCEAERLRDTLHTTTLFTLPSHPPIRTFEHRMWTTDELRPSIEEFRDYKNLISFRLYSRRLSGMYPPHVAEFWG